MSNARTIGDALSSCPTITVGQADDLKLETATLRVWLSRMGIEDGADPAEGVSFEARVHDSSGWDWLDLAAIHPETPLAFTRSALVTACGLSPELAGQVAAATVAELKQRDPMRP